MSRSDQQDRRVLGDLSDPRPRSFQQPRQRLLDPLNPSDPLDLSYPADQQDLRFQWLRWYLAAQQDQSHRRLHHSHSRLLDQRLRSFLAGR